jgi:hypothetical protein
VDKVELYLKLSIFNFLYSTKSEQNEISACYLGHPPAEFSIIKMTSANWGWRYVGVSICRKTSKNYLLLVTNNII